MCPAKAILHRYTYFYYPGNFQWVCCDTPNKIEALKCSCLDTNELSLAVILYEQLTNSWSEDYNFDFGENGEIFYSAPFIESSKIDQLDNLCGASSLKFIPRKAAKKGGERSDIIELLCNVNETKILYIVLCLLAVSCGQKSRQPFLQYCLSKCSIAFVCYLYDFNKFLDSKSEFNINMLKGHVTMIAYCLEYYASDSEIRASFDRQTLGVLTPPLSHRYFKESYGCDKDMPIDNLWDEIVKITNGTHCYCNQNFPIYANRKDGENVTFVQCLCQIFSKLAKFTTDPEIETLWRECVCSVNKVCSDISKHTNSVNLDIADSLKSDLESFGKLEVYN